MLKKLFLLLGFLAGLVLIVGLFFAYQMGAFRAPELAREQRGPYFVACLPHQGAYKRIADTILKVRDLLAAAKIESIGPCAIYYDNPSETPDEKLRSHGGYILKTAVNLPPPLELVQIPKRDVLLARFRGHPAIAPIKIYPAMSEWMNANNVRPAGPALEIYGKGVIETEMPVAPAP